MGARHQARCQAQLALSQHGFHVQRAHQLFEASRQRQGHKGRGNGGMGQQRSQRPRSRGFGRTARAADQYATDAGVNRHQQQGALQQRLADQCGEWECQPGGGFNSAHGLGSFFQ